MPKLVEIKVTGEFNPSMAAKYFKDTESVAAGDVLFIDIQSMGGEVDVLAEMVSRTQTLKNMGVTVVTYVPEYAVSCGFFFFLIGDYRDVSETAKVLYHPPRVVLKDDFVWTALDLEEVFNGLKDCQSFTNQLVRDACPMGDDLFSLIENSELPMNRKHLLSLGIIKTFK